MHGIEDIGTLPVSYLFVVFTLRRQAFIRDLPRCLSQVKVSLARDG